MSNNKNSLFAELKRRNVFRVAIAYVGVAWLLVQIADVFFPALTLPDWTVRFVAAILVLGFPLAVFFAWAFDLTPDGIRRDVAADAKPGASKTGRRSSDYVFAGVLLVAISWFALDKLVWNTSMSRSTESSITDKQTIAVLPFANFSSDQEQEYFSDGLAEELLNLLTRVTDLRVIGRTSSFKFKNENEDLREIGRQLGAGYILEGSVRKYDDNVRVTAQLIDTSTGAHVWSENFEREIVDIFSLQDSIARAVVTALKIELQGAKLEARSLSFNPVAYDLYLQGLRLSRGPGPGNMAQALDFFERAVAIDETLAPAWVELAGIYMLQTIMWSMPPEEGIQQIDEAIDRALSVDPDSADAYATLGSSRMAFQLDWKGAEQAYRRALELDPNHAEALGALGSLAGARGEIGEALALTRRSRQLDPLNLGAIHTEAFLNYLGRNYVEAEAGFREALEFAGAPYTGGNLMLSLTLIASGRPDEALEAAKKEPEEPMRLGALSLAYHVLGERELAEESFTTFRERYGGRAAVPVAGNYAQRGEFDAAFEWFERAYEQRDAQLLWTLSHPVNDVIRDDPRFDAFVEKLKLRKTSSE
ncbi:MAG: tetratricopeptide repeat protein [Woeseiaceae bacterium]